MKKFYFIFILILFFVPVFVFAATLDDITYPIEKLGNCQNREECSVYCDKIANLEQCLQFSKENRLLADCDLVDARSFLSALRKVNNLLPCESKTECLDYCSKSENLDQCLDFAQKTGILSRDTALLIKRTRGIGPGECQNKEECKEYCGKEENVDECLAFAKNYGFMSQEQVAEAIRLRDVALGGGPGACIGLQECKEYCSVSENFDECINFGKEAGIITLDQIKVIEGFIEQGGPGGCKTRQECDEYCKEAGNIKECLNYMVENNYLPQESIKIIEEKIKETEESINQQMEEFKKTFDLDEIEDEDIRRQIEERLQPYKDLLNKDFKRSIAERIKQERGFSNVLAEKTKIIAQNILNLEPEYKESNKLVELFRSFFANIGRKILDK